MDENVIHESCAEFSAIRGFTFDFFRPFILSSRRPAMFSSVSINLDIDAVFVSWIMCWFSQL